MSTRWPLRVFVQLTGPLVPSCVASTLTPTPHTFAATFRAAPTATLFELRTVLLLAMLVTVTLTRPPVTTGPWAIAGTAGARANVPVVASVASARLVRVMPVLLSAGGWGVPGQAGAAPLGLPGHSRRQRVTARHRRQRQDDLARPTSARRPQPQVAAEDPLSPRSDDPPGHLVRVHSTMDAATVAVVAATL